MPIARIRMPRMGTSVHESTVVEWKKSPGDAVTKGEALLSAESDKVEFEIESPADGTLKEILVETDKTVPVGEPLALLETEAEVPDEAEDFSAREATRPPPADPEWKAPVAPLAAREKPKAQRAKRPAPALKGEDVSRKTWLSPRVQRMAHHHGLGLDVVSRLPGTGSGGRVTARDVERFIQQGGTAAASSSPRQEAPLIAPSLKPLADSKGERERSEKFSRLRKRIAENLTRSVREIPQVTSWLEVDMSRVVSWREAHKEGFEKNHGTALAYTPFFVLALIAALRRPENERFNATCEDDILTIMRHLNLGLAVDTPEGLMVPVLRDADSLGFTELALQISDLANRTREGRLSPDEMQDGTLTLTNFGTSGVLLGNPIINPPQAAIVGTGAITQRVTLLADGTIGIRPIMGLALTFDHRANDGMAAGRFAADIRAALEGMDLSQMEY